MRMTRLYAALAALALAALTFAADDPKPAGSFNGARYRAINGPEYRLRLAAGGDSEPAPWPLEQEFPRYASYGFRDFYGETLTPATYDSIASLDVMIVQSSALLDTRGGDGWLAMTDSARVRNPDWIGLVYLNVYGIQKDGDVSSYPFISNRYAMFERNDFWAYDTAGDPLDHCPAFCDFTLINPGAPGVADSLAVFYAEQIERSGFMAHHNGVFLDWLQPEYPQWACGGGDDCQDEIDFDQDGVPYSIDADDQQAWDDYCDRFVTVLREELDARLPHANALIVVNGSGVENAAWASKVDGTMFENMESYGPDTQGEWLTAANDTPGDFSTDRIEHPIIIYDVKGADTAGTLAAGLVGAGVGSVEPDRQFNSADRIVSIGTPTGDAYFSATGDTLRRDYTGGHVEINFNDGWHSGGWQWLVTNTYGDPLAYSTDYDPLIGVGDLASLQTTGGVPGGGWLHGGAVYNRDVMAVGADVSGVYLTTDGGASWALHNGGLMNNDEVPTFYVDDIVSVNNAYFNGLLCATQKGGIFSATVSGAAVWDWVPMTPPTNPDYLVNLWRPYATETGVAASIGFNTLDQPSDNVVIAAAGPYRWDRDDSYFDQDYPQGYISGGAGRFSLWAYDFSDPDPTWAPLAAWDDDHRLLRDISAQYIEGSLVVLMATAADGPQLFVESSGYVDIGAKAWRNHSGSEVSPVWFSGQLDTGADVQAVDSVYLTDDGRGFAVVRNRRADLDIVSGL